MFFLLLKRPDQIPIDDHGILFCSFLRANRSIGKRGERLRMLELVDDVRFD